MPKREDYISKDDAYMLMAKLIANRSKDPNTRVGAVIVSSADRVLSVGYNGFPNGCSDDEFPWDRESSFGEYYTKYPYVVHAELNAILNFRGDNTNFIGASLYTTLFPCHECAKAIIQSGIKNIYYEDDKYKDTIDNKESHRMLHAAGIKIYKFTPNINKLQGVCDSLVQENLAVLNVANNCGCTNNGERYCSRCDNPMDITRKVPNYCSKCGAKFKK